ncbi:MAG: 2-C-methyl-D-erythritol 2,4-cyclodiphosphate synthase [Bdellovibrionota bacterium]
MTPLFRVGLGYDVHRFAEGRKCILGGVEIPSPIGPDGHSDADVLLHAITDAILGAIGEGDIGTHFPPSDPKWKDCPSDTFVRHAAALARKGDWEISNIDATLLAEVPRVKPHVPAIRKSIAGMCGIDSSCIGVKATTHEGLGAFGRKEGLAAVAVALVVKAAKPARKKAPASRKRKKR